MMWLLIVVLYLIIGIGIWLHAVLTDPWGGLLLYPWFALLIILGYPYLIIRNWFVK